jgi:hypothetical protein
MDTSTTQHKQERQMNWQLGIETTGTLLDGLCKVNNQQGGTIHQFFGNQDWSDMQRAYQDYLRCGIEIPSKKSFEKLAGWYHVTINWR